MKKTALSLLMFLLFIALGWAIYADTLQHSWHFDDLSYIVHNPDIRDAKGIKTMFYAFSHPGVRFLTLYSFALNYHFGQTNVFGYHIVNIIIHILTSLFVWWFVRLLYLTPKIRSRLPRGKKNYLPLLVGLIFLVHPMQIQAVTYICQRFASMATMFYVLSLCCYLKGRFVDRNSYAYFGAAILAALISIMSKQTSMTLPLVIVALEYFMFGQWQLKKIFQRKFIFWALAILAIFLITPAMYNFNVFGMLTMHNTSGSFRGEYVHSHTYFFTQMRVIPTYIRLMLFPVGLNLLYDFQISKSFFEPKVLAGFMFMSTLIVIALRSGRKKPLIAFGILWFFLTLSIESSFITIRHVIFEHRCYLPSVGFILAFVVFIQGLSRKTWQWVGVCLLFIGTLSFMTVERNKVWRDDISLWSDVKQKSPYKTRAYINLGIAYTERKEYEKAEQEFLEGIALNPKSTLCYNNLGILFMRQYQFEKSLVYFNKAISINDSIAEFYNNRGDTYRHMKEYWKALVDYDRALEIKPKLEQTLSNRGVVLVHLNRREEALASLNESIEIAPYYFEAFLNRANLYGQLAKFQEAVEDYNFILKYKPKKIEAYNNRGNAYRKMHRYDLAFEDYNRAIYLKPEYAEAYNNRGIIYKKYKQYDLAMADYNRALSLKSDYASAYSNRGNLFHTLRKAKEALADYSHAIDLKPDQRVTYYNRALIYAALNQKQLALKDAQKAYHLGHEDAGALITKLK